MRKRAKLTTAIFLAASVNVSYGGENCLPPDAGMNNPMKIFECFQGMLDAQQQQIGKLTAENQNRQQRIAELETQLKDRITKLEDSVTGPNRLLTLSGVVNLGLDQKAVIKPGEEWTARDISILPRGQHRIALWVNVAGHNDVDQLTTVEVYQYHPGGGGIWTKDSKIGNWVITGRDWGDAYFDLNVSKVSDFLCYHCSGIKLKNIGGKTLEIFAYGIIQEPSKYIQR